MPSPEASLPPLEQELLLISIFPSRAHDSRILDILEQGIEWNALMLISIEHGVFPLLFHRFQELGVIKIPAETASRWQAEYEGIMQKNFRLAWKMVQLEELFCGNGIKNIQLKGPVLAIEAYGNLRLRQFTDLDILIHVEDFERAYEILENNGYIPEFSLNGDQRKFITRTNNHFLFTHQGDAIEIHWKVADPATVFPVDSRQMWQGVQSVEVYEKKISSLSTENTILFLCMHGAKHGWGQLKWLADFAYFCYSVQSIDWQSLLARARCLGLYRQVCLGIILVEKHGGGSYPKEICQSIVTKEFELNLVSQIQKGWFLKGGINGFFDPYFFYIKTRERLQDRLYYLFNSVFMPKQADWTSVHLPERLFPLYYFIRPVRLIGVLGKLVILHLFGPKSG